MFGGSIALKNVRPQCEHCTNTRPSIGNIYVNFVQSLLPQRPQIIRSLNCWQISSGGAVRMFRLSVFIVGEGEGQGYSVGSCCCTFLSPFPSSVQSFPIRPSFKWVVGRNLLVVSVAVAGLMYHAPHKLRYRYAQLVSPIFNERLILRFEIEIYSDRHFNTPQIKTNFLPQRKTQGMDC